MTFLRKRTFSLADSDYAVGLSRFVFRQMILAGALFAQVVEVAAIVISEDVFIANGGDPGDIAGTIATAMGPLRQASMADQFLAVGKLGGCTGTWLGDSADGTTSYVLTAAHCLSISGQGEAISKDFETHSLTVDPGTGAETWQTNHVAGGSGVGYIHPERLEDESDASVDLAIVALPKLENPTAADGSPVARPRVYIGRNELGKPMTFLGYGRWGAGDSVDASWGPAEGPRRSMGESILGGVEDSDRVFNTIDEINGLDTQRWGRVAPGDSGSAWWQEQGGVWSMAGNTSGGQDGFSLGPRLSSHWEWIRSVFPDVLMYDYRDTASTDTNTVVFDNLLLQAAHAGSLGTGAVEVEAKGELWTVVDGVLDGNSLQNDGLVVVKGDSTQIVGRFSGTGQLALEGVSQFEVDTPGAAVDFYSGALGGTGTFTKKGAGTLTLSGESEDFTGQSLVEAGVLAVEGSLAQSEVEVAAGAVLAGGGTVGGLSSSGTVAPGVWGDAASYDTLKVGGNVVFLPDSVYRVDADADGRSDRIEASGEAVIDGGAVAVSAADGIYQPSTSYIILDAAGGVSGRFHAVTTDLAFLSPELTYDGGAVVLKLERNDAGFVDAGRTHNQTETGSAVDGRGPGDPIYDAIVGGTVEEARHAFDLLSGDIYASTLSALLNESGQLRAALIGRMRLPGVTGQAGIPSCMPLRGARAERPGIAISAPIGAVLNRAPCAELLAWGDAFGSWSKFAHGNLGAGSLDASTGGFIAGADATFGDLWRIGIAAGYAGGSLASAARGASASFGGYSLAAYGSGWLGDVRVGAGAAYSWHDINAQRAVGIRDFADTLGGDFRARTGQLFGEAGYAFDLGRMTIEPFAGLAYASVAAGGLAESGGPAALRVGGNAHGTGFSTLGARMSAQTIIDADTELVLGGTLGWHHILDGSAPVSSQAFADGGQSFEVHGVPIARDSLLAEASVGVKLRDEITLDFVYSGRIAPQSRNHSIKGTFAVRF